MLSLGQKDLIKASESPLTRAQRLLAPLRGSSSCAGTDRHHLLSLLDALACCHGGRREFAQSLGCAQWAFQLGSPRPSPVAAYRAGLALVHLECPGEALEWLYRAEALLVVEPGSPLQLDVVRKWLQRTAEMVPTPREDLPFYKFPRTTHIYDAGGSGVTRDDLLMDPRDALRDYHSGQMITVEEKVDGANLGLSIDASGIIRAQNRSHFVNSASHPQFKTLDAWIESHASELYEILESSHGFILYGE